MQLRRSSVRAILLAASTAALASVAQATTYTDATGDIPAGQNVAMDISSVVITNDAFDLHVTINLNPSADISADTTNDKSAFPYGRYVMGIQVQGGGQGQTAINSNTGTGDPTVGNPYGYFVGVGGAGQGENFLINTALAGNNSGDREGEAELFGFSTTTGWTQLYNTFVTDPGAPNPIPAHPRFSEVTTGAPSLSFYFPLTGPTGFGFSPGTTFNFDVWSTFAAAGNTAYDALDNPNTTPGFNNTAYQPTTATGSTFSTTTYTVVSATVNGVWNVDGGGSWNNPTNWTSAGVPNGPGSTATFGSILDASGNPPAIVTVDSSQTVGQITFNNSNTYSITPTNGSSLTIDDTGDSPSANPMISAVLGSHNISVPLFLANGVTLNANPGASLTISGGISNNGAVTISGGGSVTLSGATTYTGSTTVNSGATLNVGSATAAGSLPATTTLISNGLTNFAANPGSGILTQTVAAITLSSGGKVVVAPPIANAHANRTLLTTSALGFGGGSGGWQGLLDLTSNDLIVTGGSITNITNQLKQGFNAGAGYWNGGGGIISSAAATDSRFLTTLGSRPGGVANFDGVTNTTTSDVLVKYTYYGDADLSGTVDGADYHQIDLGFGSHGTLTGWSNGDFNYDGVINGADYALIDNTFNQLTARGAAPLAIVADSSALISAPAATSVVPEPTAITVLAVSIFGLMGRRRKATPHQIIQVPPLAAARA